MGSRHTSSYIDLRLNSTLLNMGRFIANLSLRMGRVIEKRPKLIPLSVWAQEMFGEHAPHRHTLRNWVVAGKIHPHPVKVGRTYFCSPDAEYVDPVAIAIRRLTSGA
jgi:hypothetical protein